MLQAFEEACMKVNVHHMIKFRTPAILFGGMVGTICNASLYCLGLFGIQSL